MDDFYQEVGKSVVKKVLQALGFVAAAFGIWLIGTGKWKPYG
jgi:hypothetical protein